MKLTEQLTTTLDKDIVDYIEEMKKKENSESYLISVMHKVQARYGYLSQQHMQEIAEKLGVPAATVSGVATFYHFFRLTPSGKYSISVCLGTACYVKGADRIYEAFRSELGIDEGETTLDNMFTMQTTRCLGVCGQAPVVMINNKVIGKVTPEMIPTIIKELRSKAAE
jgi:NADH:ubiquinone oxidoreductase subunit E